MQTAKVTAWMDGRGGRTTQWALGPWLLLSPRVPPQSHLHLYSVLPRTGQARHLLTSYSERFSHCFPTKCHTPSPTQPSPAISLAVTSGSPSHGFLPCPGDSGQDPHPGRSWPSLPVVLTVPPPACCPSRPHVPACLSLCTPARGTLPASSASHPCFLLSPVPLGCVPLAHICLSDGEAQPLPFLWTR